MTYKNTNKAKYLWFVFMMFLVCSFFPIMAFAQSSGGSFDYQPMEEIPGFSKTSDFPTYIINVYKFGLWVIGISAMMMIMVGGFMYITSAGNNASMGKAKGIISDALVGLILALCSYLLLYTINPELVKFKGISAPGAGNSTGGPGGSGGSPSGPSGPAGSGKCEPLTSGPCAVDNLKSTCFGGSADKASAICNAESGGVENRASGVDKCQPGGQSVSWGLFQINISANNLPGSSCSQKTCANSAASPTFTGKNKSCTPQANYDSCRSSACTASCNIQTACSISGNGSRWSAWGANRQCGF